MTHRLQLVFIALVAAFVLVYGGDWAVYQLRGAPTGKVTVNHYVTVPLKGNKQEFDYQGSSDEACSVSLFAQNGRDACWQLRRHTNQGMNP